MPCCLGAAFLEGGARDACAALGMPGSPFAELPALPELIRKDVYTPLDLLLVLAGHVPTVSSALHE